jgi:hypothetical protein
MPRQARLLIPARQQAGLLEPRDSSCCADLPGNWALYAVSVRRLIALHSGFLAQRRRLCRVSDTTSRDALLSRRS